MINIKKEDKNIIVLVLIVLATMGSAMLFHSKFIAMIALVVAVYTIYKIDHK